MTRKPCLKDRDGAERACEILHADLLFVNPPTFIGQKKYILVLTDDYSRYSQVLLLKNKSETPSFLQSGI